MEKEKEGIEIGKYINWILTTALILAIVYAGYKGFIHPCNCQASYEQICNTIGERLNNTLHTTIPPIQNWSWGLTK